MESSLGEQNEGLFQMAGRGLVKDGGGRRVRVGRILEESKMMMGWALVAVVLESQSMSWGPVRTMSPA